MAEGWIKIHRSVLDHWLYKTKKPKTRREAWEDILMLVNYEKAQALIRGQLYECDRGQSLYSLDTWAEKFNWTKQMVRTFFDLLQREEMIKLEGLQYTTRLTVCNYDKYQSSATHEQHTNNTPITHQQHAANTPLTPIKELKEVKEIKNKRSKPNKSADFIDLIIDQFVQVHGSYEIMSRGKERTAASAILKKYKEKYPAANSAETIESLRAYFNACVNISDPWLHDNMSLSIIVSKFNEINNYLKNGKHKGTGATDAELIELFATKYGVKP